MLPIHFSLLSTYAGIYLRYIAAFERLSHGRVRVRVCAGERTFDDKLKVVEIAGVL